MTKKLLLAIALLAIMATPAMASSQFFKGDDPENPLVVSIYAAKTISLNEKVDVRVKIERITNIGKFSTGIVEASVGLEF